MVGDHQAGRYSFCIAVPRFFGGSLYIKKGPIRRKFQARLEELWRRKGAKLLDFVTRNPGRRPVFTRDWRERQIDALQDLVIAAYLPVLRRWVNKDTARVHIVFGRSDPRSERAKVVRKNLTDRGWERKDLVYATFDGGRRCLKVGRSNVGSRRISQQSKDVSFWHARKIIVYYPHRKAKKVLAALECALTHLLDPVHTEIWPAQSRYLDKCQACRDSEGIRKCVEELFPA